MTTPVNSLFPAGAAATIDLADVTPHQLVQSLRSTTCPMCGKAKKTRQTLCYAEYMALPRALKDALYHPLGEGYEDAVVAAFAARLVTRFILPAGNSQGR
jgi:hypothetical protein